LRSDGRDPKGANSAWVNEWTQVTRGVLPFRGSRKGVYTALST